ncbi:hypothetical protein B566_EDAN017173 [Ephemera danica]|nr:hypothetical protein B566_EDAN017173 [Ephemera danica]
MPVNTVVMAFWRNLDLSATYSPTTTEHNATSSSTQDRHDQTSMSESNRYDQHFLTSNSGNVSSSTNITDASDRSNFTSTNSNSESVNFYTNIIDSNVQMPTGGSSAVIVGMNRPEPPMFYSYNYSGASAPPASFSYGPQASHPLMQPRTVYPQRLALIISNYSDFENEKYEDRKGNEKDVVRLKVTLTWFGFTFREFHNKKKKAILDAVEAFTNEDHKDLACVMVIVLTHGNSGGLLCAKDDDYHTKDIWKPFCDCEALKNVPKIFIFQHKSMRNEETGAIFIQAFCDQLEAAAEHETPTDILSILTETAARSRIRYE